MPMCGFSRQILEYLGLTCEMAMAGIRFLCTVGAVAAVATGGGGAGKVIVHPCRNNRVCCAGIISAATLAGAGFSSATAGAGLSGAGWAMTGCADCSTCGSADFSSLAEVGLTVLSTGTGGGVTGVTAGFTVAATGTGVLEFAATAFLSKTGGVAFGNAVLAAG